MGGGWWWALMMRWRRTRRLVFSMALSRLGIVGGEEGVIAGVILQVGDKVPEGSCLVVVAD